MKGYLHIVKSCIYGSGQGVGVGLGVEGLGGGAGDIPGDSF